MKKMLSAFILVLFSTIPSRSEEAPKASTPKLFITPILNLITGFQADDRNTQPVPAGRSVLRGGLGEFRGNPAPGRKTFNTYLDQFQLQVMTDPNDKISVRGDFAFGNDAGGQSGVEKVRTEQAFVKWATGLGKGLDLTLGRFHDPMGIEIRDRFTNPTIFYSWITRLTASDITGLMASIPVTPQVKAVGVMFNNMSDDLSLASPSPAWEGNLIADWEGSGGANEVGVGMQCGREQPDDNKHWTYHYNAYLQYHATKELRFDLDALYLAQETVVATDSNRDKGFGAYLLADYAIDPKWGAYGRYAFVGDRSADGAFTGAKQSIHQATAGLRYRMSDDLRLRLEYQLDGHKPTGLTDSYSQAVALEVNYRFPIGI